ncbi:HNH endonuclease signature motif containing protein [Actinomadura rudentiformis]|uniref:DUF222 domain-containing protein n=1 Tax=Actinomadura rudentiformis TaxID=359158 RepID=A0A6H9Z447_9ACTN|nr:HNH endonuclease signature motif containing protein [Actinomadura rudentiformis]KAB2348292.1 DUF222 domain-containing protein [Actinomadura rudentiformis]
MDSIVDLSTASTEQLVEASATIATHLAQRAAPDSGSACMELAEQLATAIDQTEYALAGLITVVEQTGEMKHWGFASTQAWLRCRMGMREGRAKERITLARQLPRLHRVTARMATGGLSYGYAATIADAVHRLSDENCATAEDILLQATSEGLSAGKVARLGNKIHDLVTERNGDDGPPEDVRRGYERSWLAVSRSLDGGCYVKGWLNPEDTALLDGTLAPLAKPAGSDDRRDLAERTAAALTTVLSGGHRNTRITVIARLDTLTGDDQPGWLRDGTPIPAAQVRRLALAARISPLILGPDHEPLYLGHAVRIASAGQRRVLETLYDTCAVQGCEVPGFLCEVDHVNGWALGDSPTDIDKLTLCCGWHNRWKHTHPGQMQITKTDGRYRYRALPPDGIARSRQGPPPGRGSRSPDPDADPWHDDHLAA